MPNMRTLGGLAFGALALAACQSEPPASGPISLTPGTTEYQQRQDQLRSAIGDPARAQQNPRVVGQGGAEGDLVRAPGTGRGGASAGLPTAVDPSVSGIVRQPGVGAPR